MCLFVSAKLTHTMPRQSWYGADHIASQSDSVSYTPKDEIRAANRSLRRHAPSLLAKERPVSSSAKRHRAAKKRAAMKERREAPSAAVAVARDRFRRPFARLALSPAGEVVVAKLRRKRFVAVSSLPPASLLKLIGLPCVAVVAGPRPRRLRRDGVVISFSPRRGAFRGNTLCFFRDADANLIASDTMLVFVAPVTTKQAGCRSHTAQMKALRRLKGA